jgi:hypothetical protein
VEIIVTDPFEDIRNRKCTSNQSFPRITSKLNISNRIKFTHNSIPSMFIVLDISTKFIPIQSPIGADT